MNEFEIIARFFARSAQSPAVRLGVGDDAALLLPMAGCEIAASVDMLVGGRHFFLDTDPERLGHKALAVNLSDMAAMGARPRWTLLAGALPDADAEWLGAFARGFFALADAFEVTLVGGDTTRGPLNLCVTILGEVPAGQALLRSGATVGDDVYVSGTLGDAALALAALSSRTGLDAPALARCRERLERPLPRVALGLALRGVASAAIDVSDGVVGDLGHLLTRSGVAAVIELASLPRSAEVDSRLRDEERALALACLLAGGDDYELCFTTAPAHRGRIAGIAGELGLPLTRIGAIVAGKGLTVLDEHGVALPALPQAFDHFASAA